MTEIFVDVCNSSREILPVLNSKSSESVPINTTPLGFYRLLFQAAIYGLIILRHIVPVAILSLIVAKVWNYYVTSLKDATCPLPLPPGDYGLPLLGDTLKLIFSNKTFFNQKRKQYGDVYSTHLLGRPTIRVVGADNVKKVLRGENTLVETQWPKSTRILLGEGSLASAAAHAHPHMKRAMLRAFSFDALARYVPVIQELTQKYVREWTDSGMIYGFLEFKKLNFDLSCRLLIGSKLTKPDCERLMGVFDIFTSNVFSLPIDMCGSGLRKGLHAREELMRQIDKVMVNRKTSHERVDDDVLSIILASKHQEELTESEIKNMCLELLFAGHGTTSSAEACLVYELARHPEVRKKIKEEMMLHGLVRTGSGDQCHFPDLSLEILNKMKYLNNVVKEILRLTPPIGGGFRQALKTFELDGYQVPKGWTIIYGIRETHETAGYFDKGDVFNPDRWDSVKGAESSFHFLPFGGGRRVCAGKDLARLMLKIFTLELMRGCSWTMKNSNAVFETFPLPRPTDNLPLCVQKATYLQDN